MRFGFLRSNKRELCREYRCNREGTRLTCTIHVIKGTEARVAEITLETSFRDSGAVSQWVDGRTAP